VPFDVQMELVKYDGMLLMYCSDKYTPALATAALQQNLRAMSIIARYPDKDYKAIVTDDIFRIILESQNSELFGYLRENHLASALF